MDSSALQVVIKILGISWSCLLACLFAQKVFIGYLALIMALWIQKWKMVHVCKEPRSDLGWELWSSGAPSGSGVDPALGIHKGDSLARYQLVHRLSLTPAEAGMFYSVPALGRL